MEHRREFKEESEIVEEKADVSPDEAQKSAAMSNRILQTRDLSRGRVGEMGPPISASLGTMRALVRKLDMLLLDPPQGCSSESVKDEIQLLKEDVEEISSCLDTLSQLEEPPQTAKCWMNEVRDVSYNMEDYIDSLQVQAADHSPIAKDIKTTRSHRKWFSHVQTPKKITQEEQIAGTVSEFRIYIRDAMKRHKMYGLKFFSTLSRTLVSIGDMLPTPTTYEETSDIVISDRMNEFINSLANDGADQQQLKVVSVLGSPCLGKTTLARVLYSRIGLQFDCRAFVRVSKNQYMKKLFQDMLSQLEIHQCPPQYCKEGDLINKIKNCLEDKRYLIIIDDLSSAAVWDIINRALPKVSHGSRIITTTQIEDVAFRCCRYQSEHVFEMIPLDDHHSRKLFFNRLFGSESNCPEQFKKISYEIVAMCGGLPLATISIASLLASQPVMTEDLLKHIHESLRSLFLANPTSERTRQALILSFNNLPQYLKTCLLYVSMYQEGYTFCKNDLVKQWMAEGFIHTTNGEGMEKVAESYLHQLIGRRFIQPIHMDYNNEVLSCAVHDVVHDLIAQKSAEENFIVAIDNGERKVALSHKARRLSILFGDARDCKAPTYIINSQVRSLTFLGLFECMPSISEFKFLRVLNLQLSGYGGSKQRHDDNPVDLSLISELSRLRYLKIASHLCIKLPDYMGGLHCLETLDIMDAIVHRFGVSVCLPYLLHLYLCLRDERNVHNWIEEMSDLDKLKHLQDLRLTFSSSWSLSHEENMLVLQKIIRGHESLKTIIVASDSSDKVIDGASDETISWDDMASPPLLQRFEFSLHRSYIFSRIPQWVDKHSNLSILKIAVKDLQMICVGILKGLPALTALSLYVQTAPPDKIIFDKIGFSVLKYLKLRFTSGIACLKFEADSMPNIFKLMLFFNEYGIISIEHMPSLREIFLEFGDASTDVEYALRTFVCNHPSNPIINIQPVDYSSYGEENTKHKYQHNEIMEEETNEILQDVLDGSFKQQPDKIVLFETSAGSPTAQLFITPQGGKIVTNYSEVVAPESADDMRDDENVEEEGASYNLDKIVEEEQESYKEQSDKTVEETPDELDNTSEIPVDNRISISAESLSRSHVQGRSRKKNMRDPFKAPVDFIGADHCTRNEFTTTNVALYVRDYGLQNDDAKPFIPNSDTLVRRQVQGASLNVDLIVEDPNTRLMDPETKELYIRSRTQEEEILLLRKQIADASLKELQLLSEKHILERKLSDLRMAVDERQEDAISGALKQLNEKKIHLEENMRLANELKGEEEELYLFTSSLLGMLAEYNVRPPQIYPSTITTVTKRLYQQMQWKIRSLNDSLGDISQPGNIYNPNPQQATPLRNDASSSYNMDANRNNFPQYAQDSNDRNAEQIYNGSNFNQDIVAATHSNYFEENTGPREARLDDDSQFYRNDNQAYSADGDPLPGIEGFQIVGDPRPGSTLRACGFPTNGTTLCNFQWVRYLEDGTRYSIEGATMYDYVVTADDVGTLLAVDCTPMDDSGRQGDLVREFANNENKITCDPEMQNEINTYISRGRADFDVFVLHAYSPEEWEHAILMLRRTGYQINFSHKEEAVIDEKYSPILQTKIPNGRTTQFVLVSSGGVNLPFNTQGITEPNSEDSDVRLRDLIVLVMRTFQNKAIDAKRKGKA